MSPNCSHACPLIGLYFLSIVLPYKYKIPLLQTMNGKQRQDNIQEALAMNLLNFLSLVRSIGLSVMLPVLPLHSIAAQPELPLIDPHSPNVPYLAVNAV
ncbi:MAG: hypothetical protein ABFD50_16575, partial [Smithella sp.]